MEDVELEQFEISDERSAADVESMIRNKGFDQCGEIGILLIRDDRAQIMRCE